MVRSLASATCCAAVFSKKTFSQGSPKARKPSLLTNNQRSPREATSWRSPRGATGTRMKAFTEAPVGSCSTFAPVLLGGDKFASFQAEKEVWNLTLTRSPPALSLEAAVCLLLAPPRQEEELPHLLLYLSPRGGRDWWRGTDTNRRALQPRPQLSRGCPGRS